MGSARMPCTCLQQNHSLQLPQVVAAPSASSSYVPTFSSVLQTIDLIRDCAESTIQGTASAGSDQHQPQHPQREGPVFDMEQGPSEGASRHAAEPSTHSAGHDEHAASLHEPAAGEGPTPQQDAHQLDARGGHAAGANTQPAAPPHTGTTSQVVGLLASRSPVSKPQQSACSHITKEGRQPPDRKGLKDAGCQKPRLVVLRWKLRDGASPALFLRYHKVLHCS